MRRVVRPDMFSMSSLATRWQGGVSYCALISAALEAAGLVAGAPDPADGRQTLWSLTPHCREWIRAGREAREDWLSRTMAERFGPAELDELSRAIALLRRLADR